MTSLPNLAPIVGVLVLTELAMGTALMAWVADLTGEVSRGFVGTTIAICLPILIIATCFLAVLPDPSLLLHHQVDRMRFASMVHWFVIGNIVMAIYLLMCVVGTDTARKVIGMLMAIVGGIVLFRSAQALVYYDTRSALWIFGICALVIGMVFGAMLLGHWYLIAPDLSFRPLRRAIYAIFAVITLETLMLVISLYTTTTTQRNQIIGERYGVVFWLLVVGTGIVFTALVNGFTLYFVKIRANQPATAMLYVLIITVLMGIVPVQLLYFLTGVAV